MSATNLITINPRVSPSTAEQLIAAALPGIRSRDR